VSDFIRHLEMRRAQLIRKHEEDLAAIDRTLAIERSNHPDALPVAIPPSPSTVLSPRPSKRRGPRPARWNPDSLLGQIQALISQSPDREWTTNEIYKVLRERPKQEGVYSLPEDELQGRNAVSAGTADLYHSGRIDRVRPGQGRSPAVYRAREEEAPM